MLVLRWDDGNFRAFPVTDNRLTAVRKYVRTGCGGGSDGSLLDLPTGTAHLMTEDTRLRKQPYVR